MNMLICTGIAFIIVSVFLVVVTLVLSAKYKIRKIVSEYKMLTKGKIIKQEHSTDKNGEKIRKARAVYDQEEKKKKRTLTKEEREILAEVVNKTKDSKKEGPAAKSQVEKVAVKMNLEKSATPESQVEKIDKETQHGEPVSKPAIKTENSTCDFERREHDTATVLLNPEPESQVEIPSRDTLIQAQETVESHKNSTCDFKDIATDTPTVLMDMDGCARNSQQVEKTEEDTTDANDGTKIGTKKCLKELFMRFETKGKHAKGKPAKKLQVEKIKNLNPGEVPEFNENLEPTPQNQVKDEKNSTCDFDIVADSKTMLLSDEPKSQVEISKDITPGVQVITNKIYKNSTCDFSETGEDTSEDTPTTLLNYEPEPESQVENLGESVQPEGGVTSVSFIKTLKDSTCSGEDIGEDTPTVLKNMAERARNSQVEKKGGFEAVSSTHHGDTSDIRSVEDKNSTCNFSEGDEFDTATTLLNTRDDRTRDENSQVEILDESMESKKPATAASIKSSEFSTLNFREGCYDIPTTLLNAGDAYEYSQVEIPKVITLVEEEDQIKAPKISTCDFEEGGGYDTPTTLLNKPYGDEPELKSQVEKLGKSVQPAATASENIINAFENSTWSFSESAEHYDGSTSDFQVEKTRSDVPAPEQDVIESHKNSTCAFEEGGSRNRYKGRVGKISTWKKRKQQKNGMSPEESYQMSENSTWNYEEMADEIAEEMPDIAEAISRVKAIIKEKQEINVADEIAKDTVKDTAWNFYEDDIDIIAKDYEFEPEEETPINSTWSFSEGTSEDTAAELYPQVEIPSSDTLAQAQETVESYKNSTCNFEDIADDTATVLMDMDGCARNSQQVEKTSKLSNNAGQPDEKITTSHEISTWSFDEGQNLIGKFKIPVGVDEDGNKNSTWGNDIPRYEDSVVENSTWENPSSFEEIMTILEANQKSLSSSQVNPIDTLQQESDKNSTWDFRVNVEETIASLFDSQADLFEIDTADEREQEMRQKQEPLIQ